MKLDSCVNNIIVERYVLKKKRAFVSLSLDDCFCFHLIESNERNFIFDTFSQPYFFTI